MLAKQEHPHFLTGLEPMPICNRHVPETLVDALDVVQAFAEDELEKHLPKTRNLAQYHVYSIALFYQDEEQCPTEYAGWQVSYTSYDAGKPVVHMYDWDYAVTWNGKDSDAADILRSDIGLRRYALFVRTMQVTKQCTCYCWAYQHSGQLPLYIQKEEQ